MTVVFDHSFMRSSCHKAGLCLHTLIASIIERKCLRLLFWQRDLVIMVAMRVVKVSAQRHPLLAFTHANTAIVLAKGPKESKAGSYVGQKCSQILW